MHWRWPRHRARHRDTSLKETENAGRKDSRARRTIRPAPFRQGVERAARCAHERAWRSADDFFQIIHTWFLGLKYSDDLIILEVTFVSGRPKERRLGLLKALNDGVVAAAGISPDDLMFTLYEVPGERISFGCGLAQRAHIFGQRSKDYSGVVRT
jgi:Tautomerase enzyme